MNLKFPISTSLKMLDSWLNYIRQSGYEITKREFDDGSLEYICTEIPGYEATPLATIIPDNSTGRKKAYIYIRIPRNEQRSV